MEPDDIAPIYQYCVYISIHRLRVEPDRKGLIPERRCFISIHRLRVEPDIPACGSVYLIIIFQSTGSVWSPTDSVQDIVSITYISIHRLRVEPDVLCL